MKEAAHEETDATLVIAHRGASDRAPENTLAAFRLAWTEKADGIEGDFHLTKDRQIVCIHDRTTKRTTGEQWHVESSSLAELRRLDAGSWKDVKWKDEKIPTLAEVIDTVPPGRTAVLELKTGPEIVAVLRRDLRQIARSDVHYLLIAFDEATIKECKVEMPSIEAHWLTSFERVGPQSAWQPDAKTIADIVARTGVDGVGMQDNPAIIDSDFLAQLTANGCPAFHVWTVDSAAEAKTYQRLGAWGVTTNRPAEIVQAIR